MREITLDNGLKVLLLENHTAPLVSVWSFYRAGSANERPGQTGIAHFVEHLSFEGNEQTTRDAMTAAVENAGGMWNGYTWLDESAFVETAPAAQLDALLSAEATRMGGVTVPEARVEPVRNDVLAEIAATSEGPAEALDQEIAAAAFKQHPYRAPAAGFSADVANVAREDLLAFYKERYVPANATLVIVGDFRGADAASRVHAHFDALPQGSATGESAPEVVEPPQDGERRVSLSRAVPARLLEVAWRAPAVSDADFPAFLVAAAIAGGAQGTNLWTQSELPAPRGTRLYRALVATGLSPDARLVVSPTKSSYLAAVRVSAADGADAAKVEAAAIASAEGIATEALADDVARAKARLGARLVFEAASNTDVAHQLGMFQTLDPSGEGWRRAWHLPELVEKVSLDDVKRVSAKWLTSANRTVGWVTPPAGAPTPTATPGGNGAKKTKSATPTWRPKDARVAANTPAPAASASPTASGTPTAGGKNAARAPKRPPFGPEAVRQVLPNGVVVIAVRNPLAPEVSVRVEVAAGAIRDNA
ncbi:MAG TPA: insulinase family protein, partial [bacterium]|nr:insulinase family protein [bacterium]